MFGKAFGARDGDGALNYNVLLRLAELEGLTDSEQAEILYKALSVEPIYQQRMIELQKRKTKKT